MPSTYTISVFCPSLLPISSLSTQTPISFQIHFKHDFLQETFHAPSQLDPSSIYWTFAFSWHKLQRQIWPHPCSHAQWGHTTDHSSPLLPPKSVPTAPGKLSHCVTLVLGHCQHVCIVPPRWWASGGSGHIFKLTLYMACFLATCWAARGVLSGWVNEIRTKTVETCTERTCTFRVSLHAFLPLPLPTGLEYETNKIP